MNIEVPRELLECFIDAPEDNCQWDHNHSCQMHNYFFIPQGEKCPVQELKDLLNSPTEQEGPFKGFNPELARIATLPAHQRPEMTRFMGLNDRGGISVNPNGDVWWIPR